MLLFFINQEVFFLGNSSQVKQLWLWFVVVSAFVAQFLLIVLLLLLPLVTYLLLRIILLLSVSSVVRPQMLIGHCGTNDSPKSSVPFKNFTHVECERNIKSHVKNKLSVDPWWSKMIWSECRYNYHIISIIWQAAVKTFSPSWFQWYSGVRVYSGLCFSSLEDWHWSTKRFCLYSGLGMRVGQPRDHSAQQPDLVKCLFNLIAIHSKAVQSLLCLDANVGIKKNKQNQHL